MIVGFGRRGRDCGRRCRPSLATARDRRGGAATSKIAARFCRTRDASFGGEGGIDSGPDGPSPSGRRRGRSGVKPPLRGGFRTHAADLAERARFDLAVAVRRRRFSRPVHSTALPPLLEVRSYPNPFSAASVPASVHPDARSPRRSRSGPSRRGARSSSTRATPRATCRGNGARRPGSGRRTRRG